MNGEYRNILDYIRNIATPVITSILLKSDIMKKAYIDTDTQTMSNVTLRSINLDTNSTELDVSINNIAHTHSTNTVKDTSLVLRDDDGNMQSKTASTYYTGYKLKDGTDLIDTFETKVNTSVDIQNLDVNSPEGSNCITNLELDFINNTLVLKRTYGYISTDTSKVMEI